MKKILTSFVAILFITTSIITFAQEKGTLKDRRDGKSYETIKIGEQIWMAENIAYKIDYEHPMIYGSVAYDKKDSNMRIYGYLYTLKDAKKVCPYGWHLPSDSEWTTLEQSLGTKDRIVQKLQEKDDFNLLFAGVYGRKPGTKGNYSSFFNLNKVTSLWTSTFKTRYGNSDVGMIRKIEKSSKEVKKLYVDEGWHLSVRCVKDN